MHAGCALSTVDGWPATRAPCGAALLADEDGDVGVGDLFADGRDAPHFFAVAADRSIFSRR